MTRGESPDNLTSAKRLFPPLLCLHMPSGFQKYGSYFAGAIRKIVHNHFRMLSLKPHLFSSARHSLLGMGMTT